MYTITEFEEGEVKKFISQIPDSMVKSNITTLFDEVFPTKRMTTEQLEKFLSYQHNLPAALETYPQVFAQHLKNPDEDNQRSLKDSHAHIKVEKIDGAKGENKQEILHTLNVTDKTKTGTKTDADHKIITEVKPAKEKMVGNKTVSQAKEEKSIIARNRNVDTSTKKTEKPKTVVVVNKSSKAKKK